MVQNSDVPFSMFIKTNYKCLKFNENNETCMQKKKKSKIKTERSGFYYSISVLVSIRLKKPVNESVVIGIVIFILK